MAHKFNFFYTFQTYILYMTSETLQNLRLEECVFYQHKFISFDDLTPIFLIKFYYTSNFQRKIWEFIFKIMTRSPTKLTKLHLKLNKYWTLIKSGIHRAWPETWYVAKCRPDTNDRFGTVCIYVVVYKYILYLRIVLCMQN